MAQINGLDIRVMNNELRTIYLYGNLEKFGSEIKLAVSTAGEAIRALCVNFPEFMEEMQKGSYAVVRGDRINDGFNLDIDDINTFKLGKADLHIVPKAYGAKSGSSTLKTILGAVLIGTALILSGGALATPILGGLTTYGNLALLGGAMILSGVSGAKAGETKNKKDKDENYAFSGPTNIYEQGSGIPLVYGTAMVGSVLISGGLDIE